MKTLVGFLFLVLLQLTAYAQPTYGERSDGTRSLLGNRDTQATAVTPEATPLPYSTNAHGALVLISSRDATVTAPPTTNPPGATTTPPSAMLLGESITVRWTNSFFSFFDWVGLYAVGAPDSQYLERRFVIGIRDEATFTPKSVGTYEVRYIKWNGEHGATFGPFVVKTTSSLALVFKRTGGIVGNVAWLTRIGKTYVLYVSLNLKDWEPMTVVPGTGNEVFVPMQLSGHAFFKLREI
ncbi:MAG: hypothetical protein Q7R64_00725 [bacterium]|nr:hypothetical protein [bacterium]